MAKLAKNNSVMSAIAIMVAIVALFAGVYAVMKVNTNQQAGASSSSDDALRCKVACGEVTTDPQVFSSCLSLCPKVIAGSTVTSVCTARFRSEPAKKQSCISVLNKAVASLPSVQCARAANPTFTSSECKEVETGAKTCAQTCNSKQTYKNVCLSRCSDIEVQ